MTERYRRPDFGHLEKSFLGWAKAFALQNCVTLCCVLPSGFYCHKLMSRVLTENINREALVELGLHYLREADLLAEPAEEEANA